MRRDNPNDKPFPASLTAPLFPDFKPGSGRKIRTYKRINQPIWTENKAHFIREYLNYFVQVTKHGAYIDGFAGPQSFDHLDAWTAALVLRGEPKWLRHFFLCELHKRGYKLLRQLKDSEFDSRDKKGKKIKRTIEVFYGDFNTKVDEVLASGLITQKEATFCLLDQRTFECHWATLQKLASYKKTPQNKIELLYFLGVGWLHRAFSGIRKEQTMLAWWGRQDWRELIAMGAYKIAERVSQRFQIELGYRYVAQYPIFDSKASNKVMYYMIHASDHDEAPALMVRAHYKAVRSKPKAKQSALFD
ncbi:MAG TPA: three-Cys-motif partner protein TcmP [Candidatus Acidoferrales bacterium]|nr:three-Cys-motif partner protein TcmP [Candidatus Acidoferrales bacterium]